MGKRDFESAPDLQHEFQAADRPHPLDLDAQRWESTEEPDYPKPSEKHLDFDFTPGGWLEQEVHTELDDQARAAIRRLQDRQQDPRDDFHAPGDPWDGLLQRHWDRQQQRERER